MWNSNPETATRPFSGCFLGGFLIALKFHLIHNWTHHHCILPQFFELFCFLARIRFYSRIRSSSSILIFKTRIGSTHKNEKWSKQKNSRCRNYRLYYHRYIVVLVQIVHRLFARNLKNNLIYIQIFWQILTKNSCIGPYTESYMSHLWDYSVENDISYI